MHPSCGHYLCRGCLSEYVRGAVRDRKHPVPCPMGAAGGRAGGGGGGCDMKLSREAVLEALEGHATEQHDGPLHSRDPATSCQSDS